MLSEDCPGAINHGVGCRSLLAKVHDCIRLEVLEAFLQELEVADIPNLQLDVFPRYFAPSTPKAPSQHTSIARCVCPTSVTTRQFGTCLKPFCLTGQVLPQKGLSGDSHQNEHSKSKFPVRFGTYAGSDSLTRSSGKEYWNIVPCPGCKNADVRWGSPSDSVVHGSNRSEGVQS